MLTNFPIQSTARIEWNVVVKVEQVQDTKRDKTKRWHRDPNCHWPIFLTKQDLKNRHFGNWRFTVSYCVTELESQSVHSVWEGSAAPCLFCLILSSFLLHLFTVTVLVNVTMKSKNVPLAFKACNKTTIFQNKHPLIIVLMSKIQNVLEQKLTDRVKIRRCVISYFRKICLRQKLY